VSDTVQSFEDLGAAMGQDEGAADIAAPVHVQKLDAYGRAYATGRRKNAVARVWVKPGVGRILVNKKSYDEYFARPVLQMVIRQPLLVATSSPPSPAAAFPARPERCATACRGRSPTTSPSCAAS